MFLEFESGVESGDLHFEEFESGHRVLDDGVSIRKKCYWMNGFGLKNGS